MYGESVSLQSLRDRSCSVCMDELTRPIKLSCGHVFCEACIAQWFEKEDTCPLCRKAVKQNGLWLHSDGSMITSLLWYCLCLMETRQSTDSMYFAAMGWNSGRSCMQEHSFNSTRSTRRPRIAPLLSFTSVKMSTATVSIPSRLPP